MKTPNRLGVICVICGNRIRCGQLALESFAMKKVALGTGGLTVSVQGLGCMGMSEFYGGADETESLATMARAVELGITFFDTADVYGPFTNEILVGKALKPHRAGVVIATKFGIVRGPDGARREIGRAHV